MYRSWWWLGWAVLVYGALVAVPRAWGALMWTTTAAGNYVAYDPASGALYNGVPSWSSVQDTFANGSPNASGGESWVTSMPAISIDNATVGELALTGLNVTADFASDGVLPLGEEIIGDLWGGTQLAQLLQLLGATDTQAPAGYTPVDYCPTQTGWANLGPVYGPDVQGGTEQYGSECQWTQQNAGQIPSGDFCIGPGAASCARGVPGTAAQADTLLEADLTPGGPYYQSVLRDLGQIISNWPAGVTPPSIEPSWASDSYTGPSTETFPPVSVSSGGQTDTVTPSVTPTYSPGGVAAPVTLNSCTGAGACTSTTTTPSDATKVAPFSGPPVTGLPAAPALPLSNAPLTFAPQTVAGACPPPVPLELASVGMGNYTISLQPLCDLAEDVRPVIVASAGLVAGFVIFR